MEFAQLSLLTLAQAAVSPGQDVSKANANWVPMTINIEDPDHIHFSNSSAFQRITVPRFNDLPCTPQNLTKVKPIYAFARGKVALENKNYAMAACWFSLGVAGGDARSRTALGTMNRLGLGAEKNPNWAFTWFERAASQGDPVAARHIAEMFDAGELPPDAAKSSYWHAKADELERAVQKAIEARKREEAKEAAEEAQFARELAALKPAVDSLRAEPICHSNRPEDIAEVRRRLAYNDIYCGPSLGVWPLLSPP